MQTPAFFSLFLIRKTATQSSKQTISPQRPDNSEENEKRNSLLCWVHAKEIILKTLRPERMFVVLFLRPGASILTRIMFGCNVEIER